MKKRQLRILIIQTGGKRGLISPGPFSAIEAWECTVNQTNSYELALKAMADNQHDLYLVENNLELRAGLDLLREANQQGCQKPIILVIDPQNRSLGIEAIKAGATDYLTHTQLTPTLLEHTIGHALDRNQAEIEQKTELPLEQNQYELADTLQQTSLALTSALGLKEVLDNILIHLEQVVPFHTACIFLYRNDQLQAVAGRGFSSSEKVLEQNYPGNNELFQTLLNTKQPLYLADAKADPRFQG